MEGPYRGKNKKACQTTQSPTRRTLGECSTLSPEAPAGLTANMATAMPSDVPTVLLARSVKLPDRFGIESWISSTHNERIVPNARAPRNAPTPRRRNDAKADAP